MSDFETTVLSLVRQIPKGRVATYAVLARAAGSPRASRRVGTIVSNNFNPEIPCHRVIRSDRTLGQYNRGEFKKAQLLQTEGVNIDSKYRIDPSFIITDDMFFV